MVGISGAEQMRMRPKGCNSDICPRCNTYNEIISKRINTVGQDIVHCWHCGQALEIGGDSVKTITKTIGEILEGIREDVCDNYCKYRDTADDDFLCEVIRRGDSCPLDPLN